MTRAKIARPALNSRTDVVVTNFRAPHNQKNKKRKKRKYKKNEKNIGRRKNISEKNIQNA